MPTVVRAKEIVRQAVPFFWVRDVEASVRFYVEGLGFTRTKEWVDGGKLRWCRLERDSVGVMLQESWTEGHHRNAPATKTGVGVSICFFCEDAIALWREFTSRGLDAQRQFVGNGAWVTQVSDPDGYDLLFESETDAPEERSSPTTNTLRAGSQKTQNGRSAGAVGLEHRGASSASRGYDRRVRAV